MITAFYAGILGLWMVFLIIHVVRMRFKHRVGLGDGGGGEKMPLRVAIRIHGNFTEIVPMALLLMAFLETLGLIPVLLHLFGVLLVLSRLLHFAGLKGSPVASKGRFIGTLIAVTLIGLASIALILHYVLTASGLYSP